MKKKKKNRILIFRTHSASKTQKLAKFLLQKIFIKIKSLENSLVLAMRGELGSGKTTFAQGFIRSLGIKKRITSPSFILIKNYEINTKNYKNVYHIDCYRIKKTKEFLKLGLKEILKNSQNIVLIEWAEKIKSILPKNTIWIEFKQGKKENSRDIFIYFQ